MSATDSGGRGEGAAEWRPSASFDAIAERARMYASIRAFFDGRGVLEVETPIASRAATTDPALESLATVRTGPGAGPTGERLYLHTSPELPMKRLLAAGSGPIYQICKVFRDGERGRLHHPEFSLLEWYRPGWDYQRLIDEVAELVQMVLGRRMEVERVRYRALFRERLGVDPWATGVDALRALALAEQIPGAGTLELDLDGWLDLLLTHRLEPTLSPGRMTFLMDYPPSQAALARIRPAGRGDEVAVAERFELYLSGIELANGFQELTDASAQAARFDADLRCRRGQGRATPPADRAFLTALQAGMPACAGVALGLDRLLMARLGATHIDAVIAFPVERA